MTKKFIPLLFVMLATLSVQAFGNDYRCYSLDADGNKTYLSADGQKIGCVKNAVKSPSGKPTKKINIGEPKPLDIEIRYDETEYYVEGIFGGMLNSGVEYIIYEPTKNLGIQNIPYGVAGMVCVFQKVNIQTGSTDFYFVAKDISDLEANSKVIFDIEDCVHKIYYEPLGEDGNPIDISEIKGDQVIEAGKYASGFSFVTFAHVTDGTIYCVDKPYQRYLSNDGNHKYSRLGNIWLNNCGPNFFMGHHIIARPQEGRDFTVIEMPVYRGQLSQEKTDTILSNDPHKFRTYVQKWTRSPYSVATYNELPFGCQIYVESNGMATTGFGSEIIVPCSETDIETRMIVCGNAHKPDNDDLMSMLLIELMPENEFNAFLGISSMWWKEDENGRSYIPNNFTGNQGNNAPHNTYYNFVEGNYNPWLYILDAHNPYLSFKDAQITGRLGNNAPIISLMPADPLPEASDLVIFHYGLVGRYGEGNYVGGDLIEETNTFEYDADSFRKDEFIYENILIDGEVDGCVKAELTIKKGGVDDDFIPPVLTFLVTRNKDNIYTDRFNTASDGVIEFYAADFYNDLNWSLGKYGFLEYKCKPIPSDKLKVEYSPYSQDNFKSISVSEVPEKYFYPGWGNYYTAPLDEVTGNSINGWFDLRITMEDEDGNRHVQTVSPAFKLLDAGGIGAISDDNKSDTPIYFDLSGRRVESPDKGFYIECRGNQTRKIMK